MRSQFLRIASIACLLLTMCLVGCGKSKPAAVDISQTPWLDPQVQISSLKEKDRRIRSMAARNLGNIGAKAALALPELERLAREDPDTKVRERAKDAIDKIRAASH